ncbi:unnamed protein product [Pseudo-nitzschia multistriata]|uniref:Nudix hydrolase domain-containing protein n=1 Tax=Pseudo-nitzschia multistriata TaxID=183589 RepID=A0A448YWC8_9STRA|nr:unnamed protein product [Pseudo-nitzschia multistriata]
MQSRSEPTKRCRLLSLLICVALLIHCSENSTTIHPLALAFAFPQLRLGVRVLRTRKTPPKKIHANPIVPNRKPYSFVGRTTSRTMSTEETNGGSGASDLPRIDGSETIGSTRWLKLETLSYTDATGSQRKWDYATRTTKASKSSTDAVVIIPLLKRPYKKEGETGNEKDEEDKDDVLDTLLVEQFRPPVGRATLEFPAGLIDAGETPEQAALRELREETGYVGEACRIPPVVSRQVCMSPGLCDETVQCVVVVVDLDNPYNDPSGALFEATPDEGEHITVHRVSLKDGFQTLLDKGSSPMAIMGLYLFAMGLEVGKTMGK